MPVLLQTLDGKTATGNLRLSDSSLKDRNLVALKRLATFWGIALPCVLIPMLHFVLVPAFVLTDIIAAIRGWFVSTWIEGGQATCPHCGSVLDFPRKPYQAMFREKCSVCLHGLSIQRESIQD